MIAMHEREKQKKLEMNTNYVSPASPRRMAQIEEQTKKKKGKVFERYLPTATEKEKKKGGKLLGARGCFTSLWRQRKARGVRRKNN